MGESCYLYINSKWKAREIKTLVEKFTGSPAEWRHLPNEGDYTILTSGEAIIHVFFNHETPIGAFTALSRGSSGVELLRQIAKVIGGLLLPTDYDGKMEFIKGSISEEDALPYFLRYAIVNDNINPHDIDQLINSIKKWGEQVKSPTHITMLDKGTRINI